MKPLVYTLCVLVSLAAASGLANTAVVAVDRPPTDYRNQHYVSNRDPLAPQPLIKLPAGTIRPEGWLRHQLRLQADGFHGHLGEISTFLKKEKNAWLSKTGEGERGWEEVPYWLKGYLNCAIALGDETMMTEARTWIEGAFNSQQEDGWFGPDRGRTGLATDLKGREDLWPNMIMLFCLQDYYEATGDKRVPALMARYFKYLQALPEEQFLVGYWPKVRGGDNLFSIYWLYNRTGESWLLELAEKNHRHTTRWDTDITNWHNVNIAQAFGEGATWWMQSKRIADLQSAYRNWTKVRELYGQVPGGMFGSDENCREGFDDPRQAIETCGIVEEMLSDETLVSITGDLLWADRCEDAAYNSLPAALTADLKALRYLTSPNQVVSDSRSHSPGIQNGGPMFQMNPHTHRCCQHNFGHGWPYLAAHLWFATPDNGLAAVFYNESSLRVRVGNGQEVTVEEKTHYPFGDRVQFTIRTAKTARFPLYLRVPGWCDRPELRVNGQVLETTAKPRQYLVINREWSSNDTVELHLPMAIKVRTWAKNHNSVSVDRGPLTYSLRVGEKMVRSGGTDAWPAWDILPETPWNYALVLDENDPAASFTLQHRSWPANDTPWTLATMPIQLQAKARRLPAWTLDKHGLCAILQDSPVRTAEPVEDITLVPMGAARLRISAFPVAGTGQNAHEWMAADVLKLNYAPRASHTHESDAVEAIADGILPKSSGDQSISRHTFWPRQGTTEWLQAEFQQPRSVRALGLYWFDDTGRGQCRVPKAFRLFYKAGEEWKPLPAGKDAASSLKADRLNRVSVEPVTTSALRLEIDLQAGFSAGVLEWQIE